MRLSEGRIMKINPSVEARLKQEVRKGLLEAFNKPTTSEMVRATLSERRQERLAERYSELAKSEGDFMDVVNVEIDWHNISPVLKWVETDGERRIWNYGRNLVSSAPDEKHVGRALDYYFMDELSGRWLGLVRLSSALSVVSPRYARFRWKPAERFPRLCHIANISVCISIQPFGLLCGGKLLFVSSISNEVVAKWKTKYGDDLLAVETTSLYGKSSQYNRVKEFEYLGLTGGGGTLQISPQLYGLIEQLCALHPEWGKIGGPRASSSKMKRVVRTRQYLGIQNVEVRGHRRGYYWGVTSKNSEAILRGEDNMRPQYYDKPLQDLIDFWHKRWYEMRLPKKWEEIQSFDSSVYLLDNSVPAEHRQPRQTTMF